jgi:glutaredoxin 3
VEGGNDDPLCCAERRRDGYTDFMKKPVRIYTTNACAFCMRAKDLLGRKGVEYEEIDVTGDHEMRAKLVEMTGGLRTVPQIWIGPTHVGGYTDLAALNRDGRLESLLREASSDTSA